MDVLILEGCKLSKFGAEAHGLEFRVSDLGFRVWGSGSTISGAGFIVS